MVSVDISWENNRSEHWANICEIHLILSKVSGGNELELVNKFGERYQVSTKGMIGFEINGDEENIGVDDTPESDESDYFW